MRARLSSHRRSALEAHARANRWAPTRSEEALFRALGARKLGVLFRRQVPLCGYIADFFASEIGLIVEVDGEYHEGRRAADARRDRVLERAGYRVLRIEAEVVLGDVALVVERVRVAVSIAGAARK